MNRGIYKAITTIEQYHNAHKDWFVELQQSQMFWYDLIANPNEYSPTVNTKKIIIDDLKYLKKEVEDNLEKRFIYFICTRTKVRFNINKKPTYNRWTKNIKIHLLIGKNKIKKTIKLKIFDINTNQFSNPRIEITEKYITIFNSLNQFICYSIHDFLSHYKINLNISSQVQYVGYTKNPNSRPTNGSHSGFNDVLYNIPSEDNDVFIYFNLFKINAVTKKRNSGNVFVMPNAMSDEIDVDTEGFIIEKCFILYFNSKNQNKNKDNEYKELKNNLLTISKENKIDSIQFYYEFTEYNEYWVFYSSSIQSSIKQIFTIELENESLEVKLGSHMYSEYINNI